MDVHQKLFIFWSVFPKSFSNLKSLLIKDGWQVFVARSGANLAKFTGDSTDKVVCLAIFAEQNNSFSPVEISQINDFLERGNSLLIGGRESDYSQYNTNINQLLSNYGVAFNRDCVLRPNAYKLYHPKEAHLEDFIVNRGLTDVIKKYIGKTPANDETLLRIRDGPRIIYPRGCTLSLTNKISTVMMTSSRWTLPSGHAICAFHRCEKTNKRIVAIGSSKLMNNSFLNVENNEPLVRSFIEFIVDKNFPINISDAKTVEIPENNMTPDVDRLIDTQIPYLEELERLPEDKFDLLNKKLFSLDSRMLPRIHKAFKDLGVPHNRLTLIKPKINLCPFEMKPATHGFVLMYPKDWRQSRERNVE